MLDESVIIPALAISSFFGTIIVFLYLFFRSRFRIRMALIENDKTAGIFSKYDDRSDALKYGLVGIMIGVGLLIGYALENTGMQGFVAYSSMVLIMGGIGLLVYYRWIGAATV